MSSQLNWSAPGGVPADPQARELECQLAATGPRLVAGGRAIWVAQMTGGAEILVSGQLALRTPGERIRCTGNWRRDRRHGWLFQARDVRSALAQTPDGVARWLQSRLPGVGEVLAAAVVSTFGADQVFTVLDANPERLREVRRLDGRAFSARQLDRAIEAWQGSKQLRQLETWLLSQGLSPALVERIYRRYGEQTVAVLSSNPYTLTDLRGIGFLRADAVARSLGVGVGDPRRVRAAVSYLLAQAQLDGHTYLTRQQLLDRAERQLGITDAAALDQATGMLARSAEIIVETDTHAPRIYRVETWQQETRLAQRVRDLVATPTPPLLDLPDRPHGLRLTAEQWQAIRQSATYRLSLLTGGPGTGKSQTMTELVARVRGAGLRLALCAPTGKAARRLAEMTGHEATTLHRLLDYSPAQGKFLHDEQHPLDVDLVVCDESSMLSLDLAEALLQAVPAAGHLLLCGDPDQLPAVGYGRVLADLVAANVVPRVHLEQVFRQAARSLTIANGRRIREGEMPYLRLAEARQALGPDLRPDFFFIPRTKPEAIRSEVLSLVTERLPRMFGLDPHRDVLVLSPQKAGPIGVDALNAELEARLNRSPGQFVLPARGIKVGSRVVQTRNDYAFGVMNGETGLIASYNARRREVVLQLDEGRAERLPVEALYSFQLGHALTVHKAQGSQARACIVVCSFAHWTMLDRASLYTACSRGMELTVVVGERRAISVAVGKVSGQRRNSALAQRISDPQMSGQLF
jgi:exodeoxyribonuclease V alpha subunit